MASGKTLDGVDRSRPLFPYPLFAKFMGGDPNEPANFAPENDGSVRWKRFHKDTFYAFEIVPELKDDKNPAIRFPLPLFSLPQIIPKLISSVFFL